MVSPTKQSAQNKRVGLIERFPVNDRVHAMRVIHQLNELGIKDLKIILNPEYIIQNEHLMDWYDWLIPELALQANFLPSFSYTPSPERKKLPELNQDYTTFIQTFLHRHGDHFTHVELQQTIGDRKEDIPAKNQMQFGWIVVMTALRIRAAGKKVILGGMNINRLQDMIDLGIMEHINVVGLRRFPEEQETEWSSYLDGVNQLLIQNRLTDIEVWITETGCTAHQFEEQKQFESFLNASGSPAPRIYWCSLNDHTLNRNKSDDTYSYGMVSDNEYPRLLYRLIKDRGLDNLRHDEWMSRPYVTPQDDGLSKNYLITGGAGFIGTNLADHLLKNGNRVTIYDNLSRPGVEKNLRWLKNRYDKNLSITIADIRTVGKLEEAVHDKDMVFHFASQVAVTSSFQDPAQDLEINVCGTFNLLRALCKQDNPPALLYSSTNKVYGRLNHIRLEEDELRYAPVNERPAKFGINENTPLEFCSPYGCSKGSADQYVLDHARELGLRAAVFRMSCIYGPHQFGTEDQGWVAHFLLSAMRDNIITLYGNGKQVRDLLYIEDLVRAFMLAGNAIDTIAGEAFNIGGGPHNSVSVLEVIELIREATGKPVQINFGPWRTGDQRYYVSDTRKFSDCTGWIPTVSVDAGLRSLIRWYTENHFVPGQAKIQSEVV